jgi:type VI secretion system secreted protein VgrG
MKFALKIRRVRKKFIFMLRKTLTVSSKTTKREKSVWIKKTKATRQWKFKNYRTVSLMMGNDMLTVEKGNCNTKVNMGNYVLDVDAGKATITAMTSIELKVGGNSIKIEQSGITIKGVMVTVQADAKLDAKSPMTTVNGDGMLTLKGGLTLIN